MEGRYKGQDLPAGPAKERPLISSNEPSLTLQGLLAEGQSQFSCFVSNCAKSRKPDTKGGADNCNSSMPSLGGLRSVLDDTSIDRANDALLLTKSDTACRETAEDTDLFTQTLGTKDDNNNSDSSERDISELEPVLTAYRPPPGTGYRSQIKLSPTDSSRRSADELPHGESSRRTESDLLRNDTCGRLQDKLSRSLRDRSNRKPIQERARQKRQTIQDMTRPLKQWLYGHRDNPYPSKSDKLQLARDSQMTITQVSNWFANARRRLKNTVRGSEMTWAKRIKLYNNYVEGNQELLSIGSSSDDDHNRRSPLSGATDLEDGSHECTQTATDTALVNDGSGDPLDLSTQGTQPELTDRLSGCDPWTSSVPDPSHPNSSDSLQQHHTHSPPLPVVADHTVAPPGSGVTASADSSPDPANSSPSMASPLVHSDSTQHSGLVSPERSSHTEGEESPSKYKHSIMQRYLNDSYTYQSALQALGSPDRDHKEKERHRNHSGSLSSHDYEEYMSSASSSRSTPTREHQEGRFDEYEQFSRHWPDIKNRAEDDLYWKEISAALALTSLARAKYSPVQPH